MSAKDDRIVRVSQQREPRPRGILFSNKHHPPRAITPRHNLQPGVISRREWLRFLYYVSLGTQCTCQAMRPHVHWLWRGGHNRAGYGRFHWRGQVYQAHVFACIAFGKVIEPPLEPDHRCNLPFCVNPQCIAVVTHRENILRTQSPLADKARQTHCLHGHALVGDNIWYRKSKTHIARQCRICNKVRQQEGKRRRQQRKAERIDAQDLHT